jgi:hypothetical protein
LLWRVFAATSVQIARGNANVTPEHQLRSNHGIRALQRRRLVAAFGPHNRCHPTLEEFRANAQIEPLLMEEVMRLQRTEKEKERPRSSSL